MSSAWWSFEARRTVMIRLLSVVSEARGSARVTVHPGFEAAAAAPCNREQMPLSVTPEQQA
jgi:hypothetical protein